MKIVTTNRSDVFNEYIRIISRYNEKNLTKEAAVAERIFTETATEAAAAAAPAARRGRGASSPTRPGAPKAGSQPTLFTKVTPDDFTRAGVRDAGEFKSIIDEIMHFLKHQNSFFRACEPLCNL